MMYKQTTVNEPIQIYDGEILFFFGEAPVQAKGTASVVWLPLPRIEVKAELDPKTNEEVEIATNIEMEKIDVELQGFKREEALLLSRTLLPPYGNLSRVTSIESVNNGQLQTLRFPVVNGPEFFTPGLRAPVSNPAEFLPKEKTPPENTMITAETALLAYGGWQVNLVASENSGDVRKKIENSNGYGFTHQAQIFRPDGSEFLSEEADQILDLLSKFLSFLRGASCNLPILEGIEKDGRRTWQRFSSAVVDSGRKPSTWFEAHHGGILPELFEKFCMQCNSPNGKSFKVALHWYQECNKGSGGIECAIILGLTALELMSSLVLVEQKTVLSVNKHRNLKLADKLKKLMKEMNAPSKIPTQFSEFHTFSKKQQWSHSYEALTQIRNSFVHSKNIARNTIFQAPSDVLFQAWQLSLWYQELSLLYFLEYEGEYRNRINAKWASDVERVPWSP